MHIFKSVRNFVKQRKHDDRVSYVGLLIEFPNVSKNTRNIEIYNIKILIMKYLI